MRGLSENLWPIGGTSWFVLWKMFLYGLHMPYKESWGYNHLSFSFWKKVFLWKFKDHCTITRMLNIRGSFQCLFNTVLGQENLIQYQMIWSPHTNADDANDNLYGAKTSESSSGGQKAFGISSFVLHKLLRQNYDKLQNGHYWKAKYAVQCTITS